MLDVHDLAQLLGKERVTLEDLGASWAVIEKGAEWLGVLESNRSVDLILAVMKLEGYMRVSKDERGG